MNSQTALRPHFACSANGSRTRLFLCLMLTLSFALFASASASATGTGSACTKTDSVSSTTTTTKPKCGIALKKVGDEISHIGATEQFTYTLTNTGTLPVTVDKGVDKGVKDNTCTGVTYSSGDTNNDGKLDVSETWTFGCTYTVKQADVNPATNNIVNTATATGTVTIAHASSSSVRSRARISTCSSSGGDKVAKTSTCSGSEGCATSSSKRARTSTCGSPGCPSSDKVAKMSTDGACTPCGSSSSAHMSTGGTCNPCSSSSTVKARKSTSICGGCPSDDKVAKASTNGGTTSCPPTVVTLTATAQWTTHIVHPKVETKKVAKESAAHVGDTIHYTISVKNTGDTPVSVTPSDPGCTGITPASATIAVGATKDFVCTHVVTAGDGTSYTNTACATGDAGKGGMSPESCGSTHTPILHPGIRVTKVAQETTVDEGLAIHYTITVANTGDTPLTVTPSDVGCDTGTFDSSPFNLPKKGDAGDTKTLTCSHLALATDPAVWHNQACATGKDSLQGQVSDCSSVDVPINHPTPTPPKGPSTTPPTEGGGQVVLGERITPGTAGLSGRTGCVTSAFNARVRGAKIAKVVFLLDGKVIKTVTKPNLAGDYLARISPAKLRIGVHRLVAKVTFQAASKTAAKTLRLSFQRCGRALALPRFTG